jgi:hypothetical protein
MSKITDTNGFKPVSALRKVARDPRIEEIEGHGMDEGRVFLHLVPGYRFTGYGTTCHSVGNPEEIAWALSLIQKGDPS